MKTISIVTDFDGVASKTINENLRFVFSDMVNIKHYYINLMNKVDIIEGDCILVMLENRIHKIRNNINYMDRVIVVTRTIKQDSVSKIMKIPNQSKVLVVNDYYETTLELTSLLYKLHIRDLSYESLKDGMDYSDYKYAITTDMKSRVPKGIKNVVDLGARVLDTSSFLHIFSILDIEDEGITRNLLKYVDTIVSYDVDMKNQFINLNYRNMQLSKLIEFMSDGLMIVNINGEIEMFNDHCKDILKTNISKKCKLNMLLGDNIAKECICSEFVHKLFSINNKKILLSSQKIYLERDKSEKIIIVTDITYIKKLEQSISSKLKEYGMYARYSFEDIIHKSKIIDKCIEKAKIFAKSDITVLVTGESGTGKELFVQSIHNYSDRKNQPFIAINCAALPHELLESELFGYEKGAFTGARAEGKAGLFEKAHNGTIFLDEIGELSLESQSKLLRIVQEKQVMRMGGHKVIEIDVRIVAATNKDLYEEVEKKKFREDLFYRINSLMLRIPPLRDRREDIELIFKSFLNDEYISPSIIDALKKHDWKGNARELKNVADYYNVMKYTDQPLPEVFDVTNSNAKNELDKEDLIILKILDEVGGVGRGKLLYMYKEKANFDISEYELRQRIDKLSKNCFIEKRVGRAGCVITDCGKKMLK